MSMHLSRFLGVLGAAVVIGACGVTEPTYPTSCSGALTVEVVWDDGEIIDWTPSCGVSAIVVTVDTPNPTAEQYMWNMHVPEGQPLRSGHPYGVTPLRGSSSVGPKSLSCGARYRVSVRQTVGRDVQVASGSTTFMHFCPD